MVAADTGEQATQKHAPGRVAKRHMVSLAEWTPCTAAHGGVAHNFVSVVVAMMT